MGEAKNRGPQEDRVAAALKRAAELKPPVISCNACHAELPEVERLDASALKGIELAFKAHCTTCDQDTWAIRGEPVAVRAFYTALETSTGQRVQLGSTKPGPRH